MKGEELTWALPGICTGHIKAWRCWRVSHEGELSSYHFSELTWELGTPMTSTSLCERKPQFFTEGSVLKHEHGVYAYKNSEEVLAHIHTYAIDEYTAVGEVALWGWIEEAELGYRAEYAYPTGFTNYFIEDYRYPGRFLGCPSDVVKKLATRFNVPVL